MSVYRIYQSIFCSKCSNFLFQTDFIKIEKTICTLKYDRITEIKNKKRYIEDLTTTGLTRTHEVCLINSLTLMCKQNGEFAAKSFYYYIHTFFSYLLQLRI